MAEKPTYEELEQEVRGLELQAEKHKKVVRMFDQQAQILSSIKDAIVIITPEMKTIYANQTAKDLLDDRPEMFTEPCYRFFKKMDTVCENCPILNTIQDEKPHNAIMKFYDENSEEMWLFNTAFPFYDRDGQVIAGIEMITDYTPQKRAEIALQESEEKYRNILESIEDGYFEVDNAGNLTFFNDSLSKILGYSKDELMGMNNQQYMDEENAKKLYQTFNKVYTTGKPEKGFDWEIIRKDGNKRYVESSVSLRTDPEGQPTGFRGIVRDVTERKRTDKALRDSQNMLQTVLDTIPSAVFWKDRDSVHLGGNRTWLEAVGLKSSEEVVGKSDYDLPWEKEQADSFREDDRRVMESGIPEYDIIEFYLRADGTRGWAKTNKVPLRDTEGNVTGVLGTYEDITEHKKAEEALRESEAKYRRVSDNSPAVLYQFMMTPDGAFSFPYVSDAIEAIMGIHPEDVMNDPSKLLGMVHSEDQEMFREGIMRSTPLIFRCMKDGEVIWIEARGTPTPLKDGGMLWDGFLLDITQRKRAEEQKDRLVSDLQKALSEVKTLRGFLPICSHCKKIRDDKGYWNQIETYIHDHSEAEFSHGICQECAKKYYPDMDLYDEDETQG